MLEYAFRIYGINVYTNYDLRKYIRINNIHSNVADDLNNVRLIISFIEPNVTKLFWICFACHVEHLV